MGKARSADGRPLGWARGGARFLAARLLAGGLLLGAFSSAFAGAPPTVPQMLTFRPRQADVAITTPAEAEQKDCKVELVKGKAGSGWVLKDASGNLLRRFYDSNGDNRIDVWGYYKDGVEVYRETDTTFSGKPDVYRWVNAGGSKVGIDQDRDGTIDSWKVISPEEVSQEVLRALVEKNFARLQALLITDTELKALDVPAAEADAIRAARSKAQAKFSATLAKLPKVGPKSVWLHLETGVPNCVPAEQSGSRFDLVKHPRGTVLVDVGGATEWFQTGPMIQVGTAWRLVDAPAPGAIPEGDDSTAGGAEGLKVTPAVQKLVEELGELDKKAPRTTGTAVNPEMVRYHLSRADLLEKIIAGVDGKSREPWIRQVADSLSAAAQASPAGEMVAFNRLTSLEQQLVKALPGNNLTGYVAYRLLQAEYTARLSSPASGAAKVDINAVQQDWMQKLAKFVQTYPRAEDTPDALLQLGMVCEFLSKEVEAKNWYAQLAKNFADKPQAAKANGAVRRLELEGKVMRLAAPLLQDPNTPFDLDSQRGKVVVVYYWASWNGQSDADFSKLKSLLDGNKELAVVCVNLDSSVEEAQTYLKAKPAAGIHLYQAGGLEGKLATDYGITVLPSLFLVGKDGKVLSRSVQIANLEDEVKKHTKK